MLAEYYIDAADGGRTEKSEKHGKFLGYTPTKKSNKIVIDFEAIAKANKEHEERLARLENGGSYWS